MQPDPSRPHRPDSHLPGRHASGWRRGPVLLLAAALGLAGWGLWTQRHHPAAQAVAAAVAGAPTPAPVPAPHVPRFASFGREDPSLDVRHIADWAVDSGDPQGRSFAVVDKKEARVWLFDPRGELIAATPALIGAAVGDDPVPGIGEKPLAEILPEEKTTPAGRFVAEHGVNAGGEDVVWVSYDLAVSMHRVRPTVKSERRLERLASPTAEDNRISFGCINLPVAFYEQVLRPTVQQTGAVVYVLPETRSPQAQFGSYDVHDPSHLAVASPVGAVK
ncbi:MAG TPA: hypothetical protein VFE82_18195 [Ramlibacter sp.]|uniref:hypothetical protein n=1 Tax=Ramlibacter sp. TaxID=1917967 RepID=UPI002D5AC78F|nr:hypothetical protein [Ramlibacter sp.]HZY20408.1 hypothetical protein [Ramlibacter sp.]